MNIKRNIIFSLESRKSNGKPILENVPIRMRVTYARNRIEFTTGYRIDVSKWDYEKQRVRNGCSNKLKQSSSDINTALNDYYTSIQAIFKEFEVQDVMPEPKQLKEAFSVRCGNKKDEAILTESKFFVAFDEFIKEEGGLNDWTFATYTIFATVKKHLLALETNITFDGFDEHKLNEYVIYLRDIKQMRNNTIRKYLGYVKWFLRWAVKKGYTDNRAFEGFKPKLKTTQAFP